MVTGDAIALAKETAEQLGMGTNILDATIFEFISLCMMTLNKLKDLANHILKVNIANLKKSEASVRSTFNPEAICDMRVSIRRPRAAIKTFESMIPTQSKKNRTKLQKLFHVRGQKRDLDVFSEFILHAINATSISFPKLNRQIDKAQKQIISMLTSKSYAGPDWLAGTIKSYVNQAK